MHQFLINIHKHSYSIPSFFLWPCVFICLTIPRLSPFPHGRNEAYGSTSKHGLGMCPIKCFPNDVVLVYFAFTVALRATQIDLQVQRKKCETALPRQVELLEETATSNSNNEHALYQLLCLVRKGDSLCNI